MGFDGFPEEALLFYEGLEADNSKAYWTDHRHQYEEAMRSPMLALLDALDPEFGPAHVFRPYRDVRFSRDKSPTRRPSARSPTGAGTCSSRRRDCWSPRATTRPRATRWSGLRRAVADDRSGPELQRLLRRLTDGGYQTWGDRLKTRPCGYPAEHPRIDLLRYRTLTAGRQWAPGPWLHTDGCLERVARFWRDLGPLQAWLERHVGPSRLPADRRP